MYHAIMYYSTADGHLFKMWLEYSDRFLDLLPVYRETAKFVPALSPNHMLSVITCKSHKHLVDVFGKWDYDHHLFSYSDESIQFGIAKL